MADSYDYSTLNWVKGEIDETLDQARQALEAYVENTEDETQLQFCATHLHQVYGTLKMVELYGAVMVAEEMEHVARALIDKKIAKRQDAYEVLMRAILQLPDYLEYLQAGNKDVPIALLPLLNDMRATCGQSLLSEGAFFSPDLSVTTPAVDNPVNSDVQELAKKLRHRYQMGLVSWFRDRNVSQALQQLADVVHELRGALREPASSQLFWVAEGLIEALIDEGLDASVSTKLLLGQVDRQIKRIIDEGESVLVNEQPVELVKNLLFYVASAGSEGPTVSAVRETFRLGELLSGTDTEDTERGGLGGVNLEVLETVASVVHEDLTRIKDDIDLFMRSEQHDVATLQPVANALKKIGDTLGMLGLGTQRNIVIEQATIVRDMIDGKLPPDEVAFMEMASGFIFIESSLDELKKGGTSGEAQGSIVLQGLKRLQGEEVAENDNSGSATLLQDSDQQELLKAVIAEAKNDMERVKDAIVSFITSPWQHELLVEVPQLNRQVRGSMSMLSLDDAAELLTACNDYISKDLIDKKSIPEPAMLDTLADAITSIEYYLEALEENRSDCNDILNIARDRVNKLGYPVGLHAANEHADEVVSVDLPVSPEAELGSPVDSVSLEDEAQNKVEEIDIQAVEVEELLPESEAVPEESEPAVKSVSPAPAGGLDEDEIDDEIIDIFLEEATEEMETLGEYFPKWKNNPDDADALSTIRRSFHTLKGSGRMVGAMSIGEFAWAFESLLNRIIDKTIPLSSEALILIDKGLKVLPELIDQFKGGPAPTSDIEALQDSAHVMSKTGSLPRVETGDMKVPAAGEGPGMIASKESIAATQFFTTDDTNEAEDEAGGIDPVLLEIFTNESERHLGDIDAFVEQCQGQGENCRINEDVTRAVHTLHGSAHMAGITDIAEVSNMLEKYIKLLQTNDASVDASTMAVMTECSVAIHQRVSELADPDASSDYKDSLLEKIKNLYEHEQALEAGVTNTTVASQEPQQLVEETSFTPPVAVASDTTDDDDFDAELLEIFIEEGVEILDASEVTLQNWINKQDDKELVEQLQREIHTLKGGARMAGIGPMGDLSHSLETMIIAISEGRVQVSKKMFDLVQQAHDKLVTMLEQVRDNQPQTSEDALVAKLDALTAGQSIEDMEEPLPSVESIELETKQVIEEAVAEEQEVTEAISAEAQFIAPVEEEVVTIMPPMPEQSAVDAIPAEHQARGRMQHEQIRVRADLLDELVNFAGEVSIYRSRIEQQVGTFRYNLTEMEQTISRLGEQMRRFEIETEAQIMYRFEESGTEYDEAFDPLEMDRFSNMQQLSRALLESLSDLNSIQGLLDNQTRESETLLLQQSRVSTELQEGLMRTRMVPFSLHLPRLRRLVRQTSSEVKKDVNLVVSGEDGELDRSVLDRVLPALEHMLRNAVDHGMETPAQRKKSGKAEAGTIHIAISREGTEIVIRISDDGKGIDLGAIRDKAIERGLMKEGSDLTDKEVLRFILESGFSTAQKVTQISGRGVGMDVVNSEIKQLGGSLQIDTVKEQGSRFTVRLPLTLSVNKALLVNVGEDIYAIPLSSVEGVARVSHEELEGFYSTQDPRFNYGGNDYRFMHLGTQLGLNQPLLPGAGGKLPVLLARAGDHRIALQVEALRGSREIVVKPVGPQISSVQSISGATILADGRVAMILDIAALVYMDVARPVLQTSTKEAVAAEAAHIAANRPLTVMVVDDSITVRKVTTRLLERNNMHVITAKDGVDAVAVLQEQIPDIFLLDIEMPRMDGYELATHIRNDAVLKTIPIIMITSRTGDKHRKRAMDIGVNHYMGKPFQEADLLKSIKETLNESR